VTDLTDRMRTCAAFLLSLNQTEKNSAAHDAADLLLEASDVLEAPPPPLGEPMKLLEPVAIAVAPSPPPPPVPRAVWTTNAGDLPPVPTGKPSYRPPRVCPACDSRANKRVFRHENKVMLACPVCAHAWEYRP